MTAGSANLQLFSSFFKIGAFTFGGGYAMLPVIKREVVDDKAWVSEQEFIDVLAVAQSSPGAVAVNSAVFIGYKIAGLAGAFCALLGVILPSFLIILAIAIFFSQYASAALVKAAFSGVRPAIAALIAAAVVKIGKPVLKNRQNVFLTALFLSVSLLFGLHPFLVIISGAAFGLVSAWLHARAVSGPRERGAKK